VEYAFSIKSKLSNQLPKKKKKLKNISGRHIQTSRISLWISTMVTKKANYLFMQQCMMGAMNEAWLVASRIHCKMLYNCHHYWDSQADSWCRLKLSFKKLFGLHCKSKNIMIYKDSFVTINNKVNLTHRLASAQVKWSWDNDNVKQCIPSYHLCSFGCYNKSTIAEQILK